MDGNFVALIGRSKALNSKVFSLVRLQLLASLAAFEPDGVTYRELKASLGLSDGALFSNLKALQMTGYVKREEVKFEGKNLDLFKLTPEGNAEWEAAAEWLREFLDFGGSKT